MALNFSGIKFQPFKDITFLDNMDIGQLKNYLAQEQKELSALQTHLISLRDKAKEQLQAFSIESVKVESSEFDSSAERMNLINQIKEARMKKLALMAAKKQMEMVLKANEKAKKIISTPDKIITILKNLGASDEEIQKALTELHGDEEYDEIDEWHENYQADEFMRKMEDEGYELLDLSEAESYFIGAE